MDRVYRRLAFWLGLGVVLLAPLHGFAQQRESIGAVGGQPVYRDQLDPRAGDAEAQARALFASPALHAWSKQHRHELTPGSDDVQRIVAGLERREQCVPPSKPEFLMTPETKRMVAQMLLGNTVTQKFIHDRFGGGRLLFQQAGVEAFDATRRLLLALEARGEFRVDDPELRRQLYAYWERDHGAFLIDDQEQIEKAFDVTRLLAPCPGDETESTEAVKSR